jgi:serpin B
MRRNHALLLVPVPVVVGLLLGYRLLPVCNLFTAHAGQANQQSGVQTRTNPEAVVSGNTAFAIDLYQQLRAQPGNLLFSPFSISTALAMTYVGARSQTAAEMADVLHFDLPQAELHPAMGNLWQPMSEPGAGNSQELMIANALWPQQGTDFLDDFLRTNRIHYRAGIEAVDFRADVDGARKTINRWVEQCTRHRIRELLQPGDIDGLTELVLTNAIYFKGSWASRFNEAETLSRPFHLSRDHSIEASMMQQSRRFGYMKAAHFTALELLYENRDPSLNSSWDLSMLILLPDEVEGLPALENSLSVDLLNTCLSELTEHMVLVAIPRFTLSSRFELNRTLTNMGMPSAFDRDADFSGMTDNRDLWIDKVIHEARVEVNEEGTEASAATAVTMKRGDSAHDCRLFLADHPFLVIIRDRKTGSLLFLGRVVEP